MQSENLTYCLYAVHDYDYNKRIMYTRQNHCSTRYSVGLTQTCPNQSVTQTSQTVVTVVTMHSELMLHCQQMNK